MELTERLRNWLERAALGTMMTCVALVLEKALDRLVEEKPERPAARRGSGLFRRLLPGLTAHLQHQHSRHSAAESP